MTTGVAPKSFVTGATGFVGGHLAARLRGLGHDVTALARATSDTTGIEKLGVRVCRGDLRAPESFIGELGGMDYVFHVGDISWGDPDYRGGCLRLADALGRAALGSTTLRRLVFVSSISVVFSPPPGTVDEETRPVEPLGDRFHAAKRGAEEVLTAAQVPLSIVRPLWVYGQGCRWLFHLVRAAAVMGRAGLPFPGRPDFPVTSIHVDDLVEVLVRAAGVTRRGARVYHAHDDGKWTVAEFMEEIGRRLGRTMALRHPPLRLQRAFAAIVDGTRLLGRGPEVDPFISALTTIRSFSNERMKRELNVALRHPTPRDGMDSFVGWLGPALKEGRQWRRPF